MGILFQYRLHERVRRVQLRPLAERDFDAAHLPAARAVHAQRAPVQRRCGPERGRIRIVKGGVRDGAILDTPPHSLSTLTSFDPNLVFIWTCR